MSGRWVSDTMKKCPKCKHIAECVQCVSEREFHQGCLNEWQLDEEEFNHEDCFRFFDTGKPEKKVRPCEWQKELEKVEQP